MKNPDFVLLAQAMGVHAMRCHHADELPEKMREFLMYDNSRPVLLECLVDQAEHVLPMVGHQLHAWAADLDILVFR